MPLTNFSQFFLRWACRVGIFFQNLGWHIQQQKRILWRKDLIGLFLALAKVVCGAQGGDVLLVERVCSEFREGRNLLDCFDVEGYFLTGVEVEETDF
jgi:hypothetical protein